MAPAFRDVYTGIGPGRDTGTPRHRHAGEDQIQSVQETQNSARENFEANFKSSVRFALIEEAADDW